MSRMKFLFVGVFAVCLALSALMFTIRPKSSCPSIPCLCSDFNRNIARFKKIGFKSFSESDQSGMNGTLGTVLKEAKHMDNFMQQNLSVLRLETEEMDLFEIPDTPIPNAKMWGSVPRKLTKEYRDLYQSLSPASRMYISRTKKVYITYGENCCLIAKKRACNAAIEKGKCDECHAFNSSVIDAEFKRTNAKILSARRGAGYWLWKPYIINKTLHELNEGEYLIYADAGIHFISPVHPALAIMEAFDSVYHGVIVSCNGLPHSKWCKRDAFVKQQCDFEKCHQARQAAGGWSFWRKGPHALKVASTWLKESADFASLTDAPNVMGKPNLPGFRDHRHDQAVLTNIFVRENWTMFPSIDRQLMAMFSHDRFKG